MRTAACALVLGAVIAVFGGCPERESELEASAARIAALQDVLANMDRRREFWSDAREAVERALADEIRRRELLIAERQRAMSGTP